MDSLWAALGGLAAGGALVWAVFSWFIDKRDKNHTEDKEHFYKEFYKFQDRIEAEGKALRSKIDDLYKVVNDLDRDTGLQQEKHSHLLEKFHEYVSAVNKKFDHYDTVLGKIIRVGKD